MIAEGKILFRKEFGNGAMLRAEKGKNNDVCNSTRRRCCSERSLYPIKTHKYHISGSGPNEDAQDEHYLLVCYSRDLRKTERLQH